MSLPNLVKVAIVAWCLIEAGLFALAVHFIGFIPVVVFQFAVGAIGLWLLKRTGAAALIKLRASFRGRGGERAGIVDEGLAVLGALALTLPGFLSDVLGAALIVPASRQRIAIWLVGMRWTKLRPMSARTAPIDSAVVDLPRGEWRRTDGRRAPDIRS